MNAWFPNPTFSILLTMVFYLWAASELYYSFHTRRLRRTLLAQRKDRGSYWIILLVVWGSIAGSVFIRRFNLGVFHNDLQYIGLGITVLGIAFRAWAVLTLGRFFTMTVMTTSNQTVVKSGPYRWLRHPAYTGSILTLVGFPLALGTWVGALFVLLLAVGGFLYRVRVEEQALLQALGEEYREYMEHTWRFFPGL
jgi:protein-S-isoprenylcysteine O-methyltransferase Ste14